MERIGNLYNKKSKSKKSWYENEIHKIKYDTKIYGGCVLTEDIRRFSSKGLKSG